MTTYSPLLGAELLLEPGTELELDVDPAFEHGVLVDNGVLDVAGQETKQNELTYVPPGSSDADARRRTTSRSGCCCSAASRSGSRS